jgi:hypothetical protein
METATIRPPPSSFTTDFVCFPLALVPAQKISSNLAMSQARTPVIPARQAKKTGSPKGIVTCVSWLEMKWHPPPSILPNVCSSAILLIPAPFSLVDSTWNLHDTVSMSLVILIFSFVCALQEMPKPFSASQATYTLQFGTFGLERNSSKGDGKW